MYDAGLKKFVTVRFRLLFTTSDGKAVNKLTGQTTNPNARCCHQCDLRAERANEASITLFHSAWRSLPIGHHLRAMCLPINHPQTDAPP